MTPEAVLRARSDVRYRHIAPESVVLRQEASEVLVLNRLGGRVLDLVDGRRNVGEILAAVASEHPGVARQRLERDLGGFLAELLAAGVLEQTATPP